MGGGGDGDGDGDDCEGEGDGNGGFVVGNCEDGLEGEKRRVNGGQEEEGMEGGGDGRMPERSL